MMYLDKDMERVMQKKKRDVINELEAYKIKVLTEMSGVDKLTLTRLRELLNKYDDIKANIDNSTNDFNESTLKLNAKLEEIEAVLNQLNGIEKTKIIFADKYVDSKGSIDEAITQAEISGGEKVLIKLGSGVYTFSKQFKPSKCVVIEGCGSSQTTLKYVGTDSPAVVLEDIDGCGFRGLGLYGGDINNRVDGVVIQCKDKGQTGGHVLEDIWLRYFKTGLKIEANVFTIRANYIRIYECSEYGLYNTGTDNQFLYLCTQGCNLGNYYGGSNNAYGMVYSIFDGRKGTYSNFMTGTRNHFSQFTTQDSYQPLVFNDFTGTIYGQFDALYHADDEGYVAPTEFVQIVNKSTVNGELRISSYRTETIPPVSVYVGDDSIFNGKMPHDVFICPSVDGVINDTHGYSTISNPTEFMIEGLGFKYEVSSSATANGETSGYTVVLSRDSSYTSDIVRNGFKPAANKTWLFTGMVKKSSDCTATAIKVFNDSSHGEAYTAKEVIKLDTEYTPFYVAVHRHNDNSVSLMVEGLTAGEVTFTGLRAYDITGMTSKRFFSNPSCYSVFN